MCSLNESKYLIRIAIMKNNLKSSIQNLFADSKLSNLHIKPYQSFDNINKYQDYSRTLRSQAFGAIFLKIRLFLKSKIQSIKQHNLKRKNIAELENLSDDLLKDIGIYRGDIKQLVNEAFKNEAIDIDTKESKADLDLKDRVVTMEPGNSALNKTVKNAVLSEVNFKRCG